LEKGIGTLRQRYKLLGLNQSLSPEWVAQLIVGVTVLVLQKKALFLFGTPRNQIRSSTVL
jgi:hypothetical protein